MSFVVAIDGPAASGKGTITRRLADELELTVLPTGDTYRCLGLEVLRNGYGIDQIYDIVELAKQLDVQFKNDGEKELVFLEGRNVSDEIREPAVAKISSMISSIIRVREQMTLLQRRMAEGKNIIAEGRDMGTVVFPDADVKVYIDASENVRAMRRYKEYISNGINITYEKVLQDLQWRDNNDRNKEVGSLRRADDAMYIYTTNMTIDEAVSEIKNRIQEKIANKNEKCENKIDRKAGCKINSNPPHKIPTDLDDYDSIDI